MLEAGNKSVGGAGCAASAHVRAVQLPRRRLHDMANPFIFDNRPVGPISDSLKVFRTFHRAMSFLA